MVAGDSRSTVTGPSLTSETCISARNLPVATVAPRSRSVLDDVVDERLGLLRPGGGDPARPATGRGVAVQRELADDEDLGADVARRAVHHAGVVVEHAQVPHLAGDPLGVGRGVVVGHADEHAKPRADRPDDLGRPSTRHSRFGHSLHDSSHDRDAYHVVAGWADDDTSPGHRRAHRRRALRRRQPTRRQGGVRHRHGRRLHADRTAPRGDRRVHGDRRRHPHRRDGLKQSRSRSTSAPRRSATTTATASPTSP